MAEIRQIQVDGVNYDLVISEDEVSATAAAQSAAQALAYKNQAQSSAAQAQTQATNASNQADRAEDAASRAEQIVGGEFLSYGGDQGLDFDQQDQARENIGKATIKSTNGHSVVVEHAANIPLRSLVANIVPIQYGTGDPSPSNVRSIDGWTRLRTFTAVANLYDGKYETGYYNSATAEPKDGGTYYRNTSFIAIHPLTDNYISIPVYRYYYDENHNFLYRDPSGDSVATSPAGAYYMRFFQAQSQWTTNIMVCESSEAVAYTAFTPSYEVTFPSSAGTVYGGTLNVKTGVLTVKMAKIILSGTSDESWNSYNGAFYTGKSIGKALGYSQIAYCDQYKFVGVNSGINSLISAGRGNFAVRGDTQSIQFYPLDESITTGEQWKAALEANPVTVIYELATPVTYQCTPTEVTALLGLNNIWADTGDVSLEYLEQGVLTEEYAKYEEERIPLITTRMFTNPNLLDNPFFTISQTGNTSGSGNGTFICDRWQSTYGNGGVDWTWTKGYITVKSTNGVSHGDFYQKIDPDLISFLNGKVLTFSVMLDTYTILATTFVFTSENPWSRTLGVGSNGVDAITLRWESSSGTRYLGVWKNYSVQGYRACKLELGNVSTLANDILPDYGTELAKCQRYFLRLKSSSQALPLGFGVQSSSVAVRLLIPTPVEMRAQPTVSYSGTHRIFGGDAVSRDVTSYTVVDRTSSGIGLIANISSGTFAENKVYVLYVASGGYIDLSANL